MKTAINQDEVRRANDARVMQELMKGPLTRRELQAATGLSWGGITNTVNRLTQAGFISEKRSGSRGCGRKPALAAICEDNNYIIGIDVNHTGLTGCVTALNGSIISEYSAEADFSSPAALTACIEAFIHGIIDGHSNRRILALGVSMQGEVDTVNGISLRLPQCAGWENVPIRDILADKFGTPVFVAHDPDCMLHAYMAGKDVKNAVLMRLDRSIGLAVSLNGDILRGPGILEAAHMVIDPNGPLCSCGRHGCLNAYVAGCADTGSFDILAGPLALTTHNLVQLFRPEVIVLAGALMERGGIFMDSFMENFRKISCHADRVRIETVCDARSAMRGAALTAAEGAVNALDIRENM